MGSPVITLLTDFGTTDTFVGVVKGVILGINPDAKTVDLTHDIAPFDIKSAAYVLHKASRHFPEGTVHFAVVDPGVGGERKPVVVQTAARFFVGPDNGIFSYVYEANPKAEVYEISSGKYRLKDYSPTFEGRDVFAPAAAWLTKGVSPSEMGKKVVDPFRFDVPKPVAGEKGSITGQVIYIDRFGNLIMNITRSDLAPWLSDGKELRVHIKETWIRGFKQYYGEADSEELSVLINSDDQLEIFVPEGSAEAALGAEVGEIVEVW